MLKSFALFLPFVAVVAAGCSTGYGKAPGVYPATGKVVDAKGKPVRGAYVKLMPMQLEGVQAEGELKSDGTFVLSAIGDKEGAVPGKYKVCLDPNAPSARPAGETAAGKSAIPKAYWAPETTPLTVEVKAESNEFVLTVK
jgi:hypothetical protein